MQCKKPTCRAHGNIASELGHGRAFTDDDRGSMCR